MHTEGRSTDPLSTSTQHDEIWTTCRKRDLHSHGLAYSARNTTIWHESPYEAAHARWHLRQQRRPAIRDECSGGVRRLSNHKMWTEDTRTRTEPFGQRTITGWPRELDLATARPSRHSQANQTPTQLRISTATAFGQRPSRTAPRGRAADWSALGVGGHRRARWPRRRRPLRPSLEAAAREGRSPRPPSPRRWTRRSSPRR
mmetsp:Transcript_20286/g.46836  ORF Transcript_20286/g.46836 Transcript_20286/m.46836 type:complete len:201 (-) Transcript_20286:153-755(-)